MKTGQPYQTIVDVHVSNWKPTPIHTTILHTQVPSTGINFYDSEIFTACKVEGSTNAINIQDSQNSSQDFKSLEYC